jgi:hypothetical protein
VKAKGQVGKVVPKETQSWRAFIYLFICGRELHVVHAPFPIGVTSRRVRVRVRVSFWRSFFHTVDNLTVSVTVRLCRKGRKGRLPLWRHSRGVNLTPPL